MVAQGIKDLLYIKVICIRLQHVRQCGWHRGNATSRLHLYVGEPLGMGARLSLLCQIGSCPLNERCYAPSHKLSSVPSQRPLKPSIVLHQLANRIEGTVSVLSTPLQCLYTTLV